MWVRDGLTRLALISAKIHFFDRTFIPSKLRPYENLAWWIFCSFSMWWAFDETDFNVLNLLILNNRSFKFRCHEVSILYEKKKWRNDHSMLWIFDLLKRSSEFRGYERFFTSFSTYVMKNRSCDFRFYDVSIPPICKIHNGNRSIYRIQMYLHVLSEKGTFSFIYF